MEKYYFILSDISLEQLESSVNGYINQGFIPVGGISVSFEKTEEHDSGEGNVYRQSMVLKALMLP